MDSKKRERVAKACAQCRRKKIKCNGLNPCNHCKLQQLQCVYERPKIRQPRTKKNEKVAERLLSLETMIAEIAHKLGTLKSNDFLSVGSPRNSMGRDVSLDGNLNSNVEEDYNLDSSSDSAALTPPQVANQESVFHELKTLLSTDTGRDKDGTRSTHNFAPQYQGLQMGFGSILSEESIKYVENKLKPESQEVVLPMKTLPIYLVAWKLAFQRAWVEPRAQLAETIAKLRKGSFPDEAFMAELIPMYEQVHFANLICDASSIQALFATFFTKNSKVKPRFRWSELMIMSMVVVICVSKFVELRKSLDPTRFPKLFSISITQVISLQEKAFKNALFYYYRICTISDGILSVQALLLLAMHLETSWVVSELNFSLISMAVRYAQDMGLHRLDNSRIFDADECAKRVRIWRVCQHLDVEVCYRLGKPPSINILDVAAEFIFTTKTPMTHLNHYETSMLIGEYDKLAHIRCYTYMKLFSAQVKYDSVLRIQEVVKSINDELFSLSNNIEERKRPRLHNEPQFHSFMKSLTDTSVSSSARDILMNFCLTYFNHLMVVNKVPSIVPSDHEGVPIENAVHRNLFLDSARTILHIIRGFHKDDVSFMSFNWLACYPILAASNLLAHCLNHAGDKDVFEDLNLLIDVSMNVFGKIGSKVDEEATKLFYVRVHMADILIRVLMRVVISVVDETYGIHMLSTHPELAAHLEYVEKRYPFFYKNVPEEEFSKFMSNFYVTTPPDSKSKHNNDGHTGDYLTCDEVINHDTKSSDLNWSGSDGRDWNFNTMADDLRSFAYASDIYDGLNEGVFDLPNFFFENGL